MVSIHRTSIHYSYCRLTANAIILCQLGNDDDQSLVMSTIIEIDSSHPVEKNSRVIDTIDRIDLKVTYNDFFSEYLTRNKPCVIDLEATENWPCRRQWVLDGAPNFEALNSLFGT